VHIDGVCRRRGHAVGNTEELGYVAVDAPHRGQHLPIPGKASASDGAMFNDATGVVATPVLSGYQWGAGLWECPAYSG
jgi:hypothetical protein